MYKYLFSPLTVGRITLKNRIVFAAHLTNYAANQLPSDAHVAYYEARAKGGAGLIITEEHSVHPSDWPYEKMIHGFQPEVVGRYRKITEAVHRHDTTILAQINHNGPQGSSMYSRLPVIGPSAIYDPLFREVPKVATEADLREIIAGYALVAKHAIQGGFDGVELQCSHSSIVRAFLSPASNFRSDSFGGDLIGRARLMLEIIDATRIAIGDAAVLGVRICGDELIEGGTTIEDGVEIAKLIEKTRKVDYINTSIGVATASLFAIEASMAIPPGYALFIPSKIRKAVDLPIVGVGRIKDPLQAEKALAQGHCDLVAMVRAQIADPELANKAKAGNASDIRLCLSCNQECVGQMGMNRWLGCIENPDAGREHLQRRVSLKTLRPKVAIIGAGPAGCQAAIALGQAGAEVAIVEQGDQLGGQLALAASFVLRAEITDLIRNQQRELFRAGIEVDLNHHIGETDLEKLGADFFVFATGSLPNTPWWAHDSNPFGIDEPGIRVIDVNQIFVDKSTLKAGHHAVIYDEVGFHQGASAAEILCEQGLSVDFVTPSMVAAQDLGITLDMETFKVRMAKAPIRFYTNTIGVALTGQNIAFTNHVTVIGFEIRADLLVLSTHRQADDHLFKAAIDRNLPAIRIGDALAPRRAHAAVIEGDRTPAAILAFLKLDRGPRWQ